MRLGWDKALLMQIIQLSDEFDLSPMNFGKQTIEEFRTFARVQLQKKKINERKK